MSGQHSARVPPVRYSPTPGAVAEQSGDRLVVLHADGDHVSTLNAVGTVVWRCLPADRTEILAELGRRFGAVEPDVLAADLDRFVDEMLERGLIVADHAED